MKITKVGMGLTIMTVSFFVSLVYLSFTSNIDVRFDPFFIISIGTVFLIGLCMCIAEKPVETP